MSGMRPRDATACPGLLRDGGSPRRGGEGRPMEVNSMHSVHSFRWISINARGCVVALAVLLAVVAQAGLPVPAAAASKVLRVLTWSDYIDPEVVSAFESAFDVAVEFTFFETDDRRAEILAARDGRGFDVVLVAGHEAPKYLKQGWLAPLDDAKLPNRQHIDARWSGSVWGVEAHGVPYFWGTSGIAYRRDLVPAPITRWSQVLNPDEALHGRISMIRSARELTSVALRSLGYSLNTNDLGRLRQAERLLQDQLPYVKSYSYVALTEESALVSGEIWVAWIYSGDALMLQAFNEDIVYAVPEEGGNIWVDFWSVLAASDNPDLGHAFINFLNEPEVAARNAEFVYYATPNIAAELYLPDEYFENTTIYPPESQLERSEFFLPLTPRAQKLTNGIMSRLLNAHIASRQSPTCCTN